FRYFLVCAPVVYLFAACGLLTLARSAFRPTRTLGAAAIAVTLAHSLALSAMAIYNRHHDVRTAAAIFIANELSPDSTVGIAIADPRLPLHYHGWRYPKVPHDRLRPFLESPD